MRTALAVTAMLSVAVAEADGPDALARRTAVALNHCRAAFHRIERDPSAETLEAERRRILDNLDLSAIDDEEVVRLYAGVLDEIGSIEIADRERVVVRDRHKRNVAERLTVTSFSVLTELAEADYVTAARLGAGSWWDVRSAGKDRDKDLWDVEKERLKGVLEKSTGLLETFWRLARRRDIPDRWLVRADDLDRLDAAVAEADPETRLRRLATLDRFMECYPPHRYHVARTLQALGRLDDAREQFAALTEDAVGSFRRDEMLASAWVNLALLREAAGGRIAAAEAAAAALEASTDAWAVNVAAAGVLMRAGRYEDAENAVLANIDADLETARSRVALLAVRAGRGDGPGLAELLADTEVVASAPVPVLLRCAHALAGETLPPLATARLHRSLTIRRDDESRPGSFVLTADRSWRLERALFAVRGPAGPVAGYDRPRLASDADGTTIAFRPKPDVTLTPADEISLVIRYPDGSVVGTGDVTLAFAPVKPPFKRVDADAWARFLRPGTTREPARPTPHRYALRSLDLGSEVIAFGPRVDSRQRASVESIDRKTARLDLGAFSAAEVRPPGRVAENLDTATELR
ncbi:MAG: hypothetical protein AAF532_13085 [Planctomycetota bacterium]